MALSAYDWQDSFDMINSHYRDMLCVNTLQAPSHVI